MKKILDPLRKNVLSITGLFMAALVFASCKKEKEENTRPPAAAVMAFNLVPDRPATIVTLDGNSLTNAPLAYTSYTGAYLQVFPGSRMVEAVDASTGSPLANSSQVFEVNKYYSVFTLGSNGAYRNVIVEDELDSIPVTTGNAFVRFVNGLADSSSAAVNITAGTNTIDENAAYGHVSPFSGVAPGNLTVSVSNESNVNTRRTFTVEKDKVYTVLLVGMPGSTDSTKAVQIKYITNGTVTP